MSTHAVFCTATIAGSTQLANARAEKRSQYGTAKNCSCSNHHMRVALKLSQLVQMTALASVGNFPLS